MKVTNKKKKILWFDVETTGLNAVKNDIIELACIVEIDKKVIEKRVWHVRPFSFTDIEQEALDITGYTISELREFPKPQKVYKEFVSMLEKYVDRFESRDKFTPGAYNANFDVEFLQQFFLKNDDIYLGSWIDWQSIDPLSMIRFLEFCGHRFQLENHKLVTLCARFGIELDPHKAMSDIESTRKLAYKMRRYVRVRFK